MSTDDHPDPDAPTPWWKIRGVGAAAVVLFGVGVLLVQSHGGTDQPAVKTPPAADGHFIAPTKDKSKEPEKKEPPADLDPSAADSSKVPLSPEEAKEGCLIPALAEGESVPSFDIHYKEGVSTDAKGGHIEPGLYRLSAAYASKKDFTAGRWSMLLDVAEDGQGAYYRRLGMRAMKSRMRWTAQEGRFFITMLCPDQVVHRFDYAIDDKGLRLIAEGGFVLPFERYGDSRVQKLIESGASELHRPDTH
jgi:hypothetical protein